MKTDLKFYIKKVPNFLDKKTCEKTILEIKKLQWEEHSFAGYDEKGNLKLSKYSGEQELDVAASNQQSESYNIIMQKLWQEIKNYQQDYNFHWFDGWTGYTSIRFNRYEKSKKMAEHCDNISSMFDGTRKGVPILSLLGVLNDNYKGGEFIMLQNKKINLKQGDLLIFPSNFLYPHKVEPVTKGVRYSFISWVW